MLLGVAGSRRTVRLIDVRHLYELACRPLAGLLPPGDGGGRERAKERLGKPAREIVARAEEIEHLRPRVQHRALADAASLWRTWRAIKDEGARRVTQETSR